MSKEGKVEDGRRRKGYERTGREVQLAAWNCHNEQVSLNTRASRPNILQFQNIKIHRSTFLSKEKSSIGGFELLKVGIIKSGRTEKMARTHLDTHAQRGGGEGNGIERKEMKSSSSSLLRCC